MQTLRSKHETHINMIINRISDLCALVSKLMRYPHAHIRESSRLIVNIENGTTGDR